MRLTELSLGAASSGIVAVDVDVCLDTLPWLLAGVLRGGVVVGAAAFGDAVVVVGAGFGEAVEGAAGLTPRVPVRVVLVGVDLVAEELVGRVALELGPVDGRVVVEDVVPVRDVVTGRRGGVEVEEGVVEAPSVVRLVALVAGVGSGLVVGRRAGFSSGRAGVLPVVLELIVALGWAETRFCFRVAGRAIKFMLALPVRGKPRQ
jgi:hypothetical protein